MNKNVLIILITIIFPALVSGQSYVSNVSKVGTSAATFLEIPIGAKAVGMGGAFVSIANDATTLYWNAAGIAKLPQSEVVGVHSSWIAGTSFDYAAVALKLGGFGALGLSLTSLSMDDMKVRTIEKPDGTGEYFSAGDLAVGLSYAFELTDRFAIGFTGKYIQQNIWHMTARGFAIDVGSSFRTDLFNGMVIGAAITNFGTDLQLSGRDNRRYYRLDETKLGSNARVPFNIEMDTWDLPLALQFGVSTNVFKSNYYRWTMAVDAIHPSDNYQSVNIGTEMALKETLFIRAGYQSLFLDEAEGGLSLGFGFTSSMLFTGARIKIDYAYRDMGRLEDVQFVSLGVSF